MPAIHVLHSERNSGAFAVQSVLEATGAEYRIVEVAEKSPRPASLLKLNPLGQVPVLELPDGTIMTESAAIVIHLADALAPGRLAPDLLSPARPTYLRLLLFMAVNLYTADLRLYYPARYTADPAGADGVKQAALAHMDAQFAIIDQAIGDNRFLLSDDFSAADPYLLMLSYWHPEPQTLFARHPGIARVCDSTRQVPAVAAANAWHRIW